MPTIADLLTSLHTHWRVNDRKSIPNLMAHVRRLDKYFGALDAKRLRPQNLQDYTLMSKVEGRANDTINKDMAILRAAYRLGHRQEEIDRVPAFPRLKVSNVRQGTYTGEEVARLMAELPAHYRPLIRYAYLTGRRSQEIRSLRWDDVDLGRRVITVRQSTTKSGEPDTIPLEGELFTLLLDLWEVRTRCPWVFHHNGQPIGKFQATFKRAAERAGLPDRIFHDFRRTVATDLEEAKVPRSVAMRITGHKTEQHYARYRIVNTDSVRRGMTDLETYRQGRNSNGNG